MSRTQESLSTTHDRVGTGVSLTALVLAAFFWLPASTSAQASFVETRVDIEIGPEIGDVTFTRDVAPILQQNCQVCHQEGSIGPMPLMTYEQTRRYSARIRREVVARNMPPYHLDAEVGIQAIKNDWRLSEHEIATVAAWVDQGAPMGDPADMPPAVEWPDYSEWRLQDQLGEPDLVIASIPFTVPADGGDMWYRPVVPTGLTEDRYIRAVEIKPSLPGRRVVHHANGRIRVPGQDGELRGAGLLTEFAMGKVGEIFPEDGARMLRAGSSIEWDIHYYPIGEVVVDDVAEIGVWLHPEGHVPPYPHRLSNWGLQGDLVIPPHGTAMTQGFRVFNTPVRLDSYQAHGHTRLVAGQIEAVYPDGRRELLSRTRFNARWHHSYIYEDDARPLLPAGTTLVMTHWYDNTADNPVNPDPDVWVSRGSRTTDEMSHEWISWTALDEEAYERLLAEREAKTGLPIAARDDN